MEKLQHHGCCGQYRGSLGGAQTSNNEQCVQSQEVARPNVAQLQQNIVSLANTVAFETVVEADVSQLLESREDALSNEELMQLEQGPAGEQDSEDAQPALRQLTTESSRQPSHILRLVYRPSPVAAPTMSGS